MKEVTILHQLAGEQRLAKREMRRQEKWYQKYRKCPPHRQLRNDDTRFTSLDMGTCQLQTEIMVRLRTEIETRRRVLRMLNTEARQRNIARHEERLGRDKINDCM